MRMKIPSVLAVALLIACGGGGGDGSPDPNPTGPNNPNPPNTPTPVNGTVTMVSESDGYSTDSHSFSPQAVTITRNGTVTWTNSTGFQHNVTFVGTGAPSSIPDHTSGSNARAFTTTGTFNYSCTNHVGMTGSVTVQ